MISGATDGIGLEYAREFARRGHSLVLIGRSEEKLARVRTDLSRLTHPSNIVTILQDLDVADSEVSAVVVVVDCDQLTSYLGFRRSVTVQAYAELAAQVKGTTPGAPRDIGILINNAGVMHESPNRFLDQPEDGLWSHVRVNMAATLMVTRAVLPSMVAKRRGLVINISSIAASRPLPLMGVYSASKKFIEYFSETLAYEYKSYGIDVQTVTPSYIATKMTKWSNTLQSANIMTPDAASFAANAVATIGRSNKTTGYWAHGIQWFMYEWMTPDWLWSLSSWHLLKTIDSSQKAK